MKTDHNHQSKLWDSDQQIIESLLPIKKIRISKEAGRRIIKCFCGVQVANSIVPHIRQVHPEVWKEWKATFVSMRNQKWSYRRIMNAFKADGKHLFSWSIVESELRKMEENGEAELKIWEKDEIDRWEPPKDFQLERTTVWNFSKRGSWAVHQSDYRGNWPPQLARNLISLFTKEGDWVVDLFVGGGTTLIEAWLTGRRSLGIDINDFAVKTTKARLEEMEEKARHSSEVKLDPEKRPIVVKGNSQQCDQIFERYELTPGTVALFCAHPPYLDALPYGYSEEDDLSRTSDVDKFCSAIRTIAIQAKRWLHDDGHLALLVGDTRRRSRLIPLGLRLVNEFISAGYELDEVIIKTQNQDQSTHLWANNKSLKFLIAHEYLFVFSKSSHKAEQEP